MLRVYHGAGAVMKDQGRHPTSPDGKLRPEISELHATEERVSAATSCVTMTSRDGALSAAEE
jgi:hypothetical protein